MEWGIFGDTMSTECGGNIHLISIPRFSIALFCLGEEAGGSKDGKNDYNWMMCGYKSAIN